MARAIEFIKKVVDVSNDYELVGANGNTKIEYLKNYIKSYQKAADALEENKGVFATGYPFYALKGKEMKGTLPIINEQFRYNYELAQAVDESNHKEWTCYSCMSDKDSLLPDLKQICKVCPEMEDSLKPRKVINRLPDMDMWMICEQKDLDHAKENLAKTLAQYGFRPSDINPIKTIYEIEQVVQSLKKGEVSKIKLPIDTHIIDRVTLYNLINQVPDKLDYCIKHDKVPFLPIHPISLRKTWQQDDTAYNFVLDYLCSFTELELDPKMQSALDDTRYEIANKYSTDKLYNIMLQTGGDSVRRRQETPELKKSFEERIESWLEK